MDLLLLFLLFLFQFIFALMFVNSFLLLTLGFVCSSIPRGTKLVIYLILFPLNIGIYPSNFPVLACAHEWKQISNFINLHANIYHRIHISGSSIQYLDLNDKGSLNPKMLKDSAQMESSFEIFPFYKSYP